MHHLTSQLIIYRNDKNSILNNLSDLFREYENKNYQRENLISAIYQQIHNLLNLATEYGFNKNLWHNYLAYLLATEENPFTLVSEKVGRTNGSVNEFVKNDLNIFKKLFDYDFNPIEDDLNINCFSQLQSYNAIIKSKQVYNNDVSCKVMELSDRIEKCRSIDEFYDIITSFYKHYGVGNLGLNRAFKLTPNSDKLLTPITSLDDVTLDDLIGYRIQKDKLIENTESFVNGRRANNVLLYGDAGTGKSTSIKAILNQYYDRGLRMIEVYKHETRYLPDIISLIKNRNYRFILYMDDLSFEESESEYKYLKALIEGGIETKPDNVLIYATSNRRHIINESWNERTSGRPGDMYKSDTIRETLSLVDRFGIKIGYFKPSMKEYFNIVIKKAREYPEITYSDEELMDIANKWIMTHSGPSGRTAEQLIIHLLGKV